MASGQAHDVADFDLPERRAELAKRIVSDALNNGIGPDDRLPTERELARDLGVTRSMVRHALAIMESQGYISREVGRGTYLRAPRPPQPKQAAANGPRAAFAPADVMMVRRLLEPPAMPLSVAWATGDDFDEMDRCVNGGDHAKNYEEFEMWDLALHRAIIGSTHSPLLVTLYASIEAARHGHIWGDLKRRSASAERRRLYQADHHHIVAMLKSRDSTGAIRSMRGHLARVSSDLNATDPAAGIWK